MPDFQREGKMYMMIDGIEVVVIGYGSMLCERFTPCGGCCARSQRCPNEPT